MLSALSLIGGDESNALPSYAAFLADYSDAFRTFKHGALHGTLIGIFLVFPIILTNAMFERKSFKYALLNMGYWTITIALMGGILCQWG